MIKLRYLTLTVGASLALASCGAQKSKTNTEFNFDPPDFENSQFSEIVKNTMKITDDQTGLNIVLVCGPSRAKSLFIEERDDIAMSDWKEEMEVDTLYSVVTREGGRFDIIFKHDERYYSSLEEGINVIHLENKNVSEDFVLITHEPDNGYSSMSETHSFVSLPNGGFVDLWTRNLHEDDIFEMRNASVLKSKCKRYFDRPEQFSR